MRAGRQAEEQDEKGADTLVMPPEQLDALVATLDEPGPAPGLARAVWQAQRVGG